VPALEDGGGRVGRDAAGGDHDLDAEAGEVVSAGEQRPAWVVDVLDETGPRGV
jgi:hypothetical protein